MLRFTMLALGVLFLSLPAYAKETIDNPEFASWNKFKVGATVTLRADMTAAGNKTTNESTHTLKSKSADKIVVTTVNKTFVNIPGQGQREIATPAADREIPAKLPKITLPPTAPNVPKPKVTTGEETLTVAGKSIKCKWTQSVVKGPMGTVTAKTWTSSEVPGGTVKMSSSKRQVTSANPSSNIFGTSHWPATDELGLNAIRSCNSTR